MPREFWHYTPAETSKMIEWGLEKMDQATKKFSVLLSCILNAPHVTREDGRAWTPDDLLPGHLKHEMTDEELEAAWLSYCD